MKAHSPADQPRWPLTLDKIVMKCRSLTNRLLYITNHLQTHSAHILPAGEEVTSVAMVKQ